MGLRRLYGFDQRLYALLDGGHDLLAAIAFIAEGILGQGLAQALEHAVVVDDQAEVLARVAPVGAGDGLHQGMGLHRLVDIKSRQALHVETGQPHGADDGDTKRMFRILEGHFHIHPLAVRGLKTLLH